MKASFLIVKSALAVVAGWLVPLIILAFYKLISTRNIHNVPSFAAWVGAFTLISWLLFVIPTVAIYGTRPILINLRISWIGWSMLALISYLILTVPFSLPAHMANWRFVVLMAWYPIAMGCISGVIYATLANLTEKKV
jgi:hypothetical protein